MSKRSSFPAIVLALTLSFASSLQAQMEPTTRRGPEEGSGPFDRLIIRGVTVIDGATDEVITTIMVGD